MKTEQQQRYLRRCAKASVGLINIYLARLVDGSIKNEPKETIQSLSGTTKGFFSVCNDLNPFYTSLLGNEVLQSAIFGGCDQINPYVSDYFVIAVSQEEAVLFDGEIPYRFFVAYGPSLTDKELEDIIYSILVKQGILGLIKLPGTNNGTKKPH